MIKLQVNTCNMCVFHKFFYDDDFDICKLSYKPIDYTQKEKIPEDCPLKNESVMISLEE